VKQKKKASYTERFGENNPMHSQEVKDTQKRRNQEKYQVDNVFQLESVKQKKLATYRAKYNRDNPNQAHISLESLAILEDKEKLQELYKNNSMEAIGLLLGAGSYTVYRRLKAFGVETKTKWSSQPEREIAAFIGEEVKIIKNRKKLIYPSELDLYLPDYQLAIEYNGQFYHSFYDETYHLNKTTKCEELGIQLFHIFEFEWLNPIQKEIWKSLINGKLGRNKLVETKDFRKVEQIEVQKFLEQNHLEGYSQVENNYGLYFDGELVSIACFSGDKLLRHCDKVGFQVRDSFLLFLCAYNKDVVYLADRRWNYFQNCESTKPGLLLFKNNKKTERDANRQLWDCGKWVLNINISDLRREFLNVSTS
jgi:hypothetical protein